LVSYDVLNFFFRWVLSRLPLCFNKVNNLAQCCEAGSDKLQMAPNPFKLGHITRFEKKTFILQVPGKVSLSIRPHLSQNQLLINSNHKKFPRFCKDFNGISYFFLFLCPFVWILWRYLKSYYFLGTKSNHKVLSHDLSTQKNGTVMSVIYVILFDHTTIL